MTLLTKEVLEPSVSSESEPRRGTSELKYKKKSLWKPIAKNEIRIRTSGFRHHRKGFFIFTYALLLLWAFVIAPYIFDLFMQVLLLGKVSSLAMRQLASIKRG